MRGYVDAQARQIFRDLIDMPADVQITDKDIVVRFHRRAQSAHPSCLRLMHQPLSIPWWNGLTLRMEAYHQADTVVPTET